MKVQLIAIVCWTASFFSFAQTNTISQWGRELQQRFPDQYKRAYAIYYWITQNITYDWEAYHGKRKIGQSIEETLKRRKGVCADYAALYCAIAEAAGLVCKEISGIAKGFGYELGVPLQETNHAWNAVYVNKKWILLDATWGAKDPQLKKPANNYYFDPPPEKFIFSHFPEEPHWQLLKPPLSLHEFERKPFVYAPFMKTRIELLHNAREVRIQAQQDTLSLLFRLPPNYLLLASLTDVENKRDRDVTVLNPHPDVFRVLVNGISQGKVYQLHIFAGPKKNASFGAIVKYFIVRGDTLPYTTTSKSKVMLDSLTEMPSSFLRQYVRLKQKEDHLASLKLLYEYVNYYPSNPWLQTAIAENLEALGKTQEAIRSYLKAISLRPNYYRANYALGILYYNQALRIRQELHQLSERERHKVRQNATNKANYYFAMALQYLQTAWQQQPDNAYLKQVISYVQSILH
ncbi:MAG: transglutaminase domain-containing protein [Cytophagales bacterium]|nr:tetratricopeptide repeat protein [Bernardetiaceae bacterium]MDW8210753.1 transglutaminase domain-containing protein [Cytophagales bacterium]